MPARLTHAIPVFKPGGAELQLASLAKSQVVVGDEVEILCLAYDQPLRDEMLEAGVRVCALRADGLRAFLGTARRARRGDVIHSWMYHGFLMGAALRPLGRATHIWGVRRTEPFSPGLKRRTRAVVRLDRLLAPRAAHGLVFCAQTTMERHVEAGFRAAHMAVTLNSVPAKFLEPRPERSNPRFTVGCLTRWTVDKGIDVLLSAWSAFVDTGRQGTLLLAGPGIDQENDELAGQVRDAGVEGSVELLGPFREPRDFHQMLDVYVSPSRTEGFPNVVAEAMATGVAVIATDVGGTSEVMGTTGALVPNEDAEAITSWLCDLHDDPARRLDLGTAARQRCADEFSVEATEQSVRAAYRAAGATTI